MNTINIRPFLETDISLGQSLVEESGWNQTEVDWKRTLMLCPDGCFVAELNSEAVGTTTCCLFGKIGWIAMVLVKSNCRGLGIGEKLVSSAIEFLVSSGVDTIRLDATSLGQKLYLKLGFENEYEVIRYIRPGDNQFQQNSSMPGSNPPDRKLIDECSLLDEKITGTKRKDFLSALTVNTIFTEVNRNEKIEGYSLYRIGRNAIQLGPAIALTPDTGARLMNKVLENFPNNNCCIDIPLNNSSAISWAESNGFVKQRSFIRMFRGVQVTDHPEQIWASSGPEKG